MARQQTEKKWDFILACIFLCFSALSYAETEPPTKEQECSLLLNQFQAKISPALGTQISHVKEDEVVTAVFLATTDDSNVVDQKLVRLGVTLSRQEEATRHQRYLYVSAPKMIFLKALEIREIRLAALSKWALRNAY